MARVYLFVEGQTEQTFANTVLRPHLAHFGVYLHGAVMIAHARRKGDVHRGGAIRYQPVKDDIQRFQRQEKSADVRFTTMIDLYKLMQDFPTFRVGKRLAASTTGRVTRVSIPRGHRRPLVHPLHSTARVRGPVVLGNPVLGVAVREPPEPDRNSV